MERVVAAAVIATALAVWPGMPRPFSTVKEGILVLAAVMACGFALFSSARPPPDLLRRWAGPLWIASVALSALTGRAPSFEAVIVQGAAGLWLLALLWFPPGPRLIRGAIGIAGVIVAGVALLQAVGLDPFAWLGWYGSHPGARMRVFSTLGNPDFVSAYVGTAAFVTAGEWLATRKPRWLAAVVLELAALVSSGSWAGVLALATASLAFAVASQSRRSWLLVAAAVLCTGWLAAIRPPGRALEGRWYLWRVAAPAVLEAPLLGHGPGAVVALWPGWEAAARAELTSERDHAFAGDQDHVHCDPLEWALELGLPGSMGRLAFLVAVIWRALSARTARHAAAGSALLSLVVRSTVDFPFARPAELCLACALVSLALEERGPTRR